MNVFRNHIKRFAINLVTSILDALNELKKNERCRSLKWAWEKKNFFWAEIVLSNPFVSHLTNGDWENFQHNSYL